MTSLISEEIGCAACDAAMTSIQKKHGSSSYGQRIPHLPLMSNGQGDGIQASSTLVEQGEPRTGWLIAVANTIAETHHRPERESDMPRPIPVYIVPKPSFGGQVIDALLIFGFAMALLTLAIIAALGLGVLYLAFRVMLAAPGPFFSLAIWGGGLYLARHSAPLMIGWTALWFVILPMILARGADATEKDATFKALPAPDA